MMTHFPGIEENYDIEDGDWRPLNFELAPFGLPAPERIILENCSEAGGAYEDKALALWPVGTRAIALGTIRLGTIRLGAFPLGTSLLGPRTFRPIAAWAFGLRQRSLDATAHDNLRSGMIRLRSAKAPGGHGEIGTNARLGSIIRRKTTPMSQKRRRGS